MRLCDTDIERYLDDGIISLEDTRRTGLFFRSTHVNSTYAQYIYR